MLRRNPEEYVSEIAAKAYYDWVEANVYLEPPAPSTPHFQFGSGLWQNIPPSDLPLVVDQQTKKATHVLIEHELIVPNHARLQLVAMAAAEATVLFYQASLERPSSSALEDFFAHFVVAAVRPRPTNAISI